MTQKMNLIEYLIQEDALGYEPKIAAAATKILTEILPIEDVQITVNVGRNCGDDYLRNALYAKYDDRMVSPLKVASYRDALEAMQRGTVPSPDVLKSLVIKASKNNETMARETADSSCAVGNGAHDEARHIAYIKTVIDSESKKSSWKVIQKKCIDAVKNDKEKQLPLVLINGALAKRTDEEAICDKTFQNWISDARKIK